MNKLNLVLSVILMALVVYLLIEVRELKNSNSGEVGRYQPVNDAINLVLDSKEGKLIFIDIPPLPKRD